jgi:hypothetical protein
LEEITVQSTQNIISQTPETPYNYTIVIAGTGGVIALFLAILVIQKCLKMCFNKQKDKGIKSVETNKPAEQEEVYHEINELNFAINDQSYLDISEQGRKESSFQHLYTAKRNSYQKIEESPKYIEQVASIPNTNNPSTNGSNSSDGSTDSYLKPRKQANRHSYIEVTDLVIHPTPQSESSSLSGPQKRSSSQYDDVIHPQTTRDFRDTVDDTDHDGSYLDVVNCDQHDTYLDVVHSDKR